MRRFLAAALITLATTDAGAENTWARKWNYAVHATDYEEAAREVEYDYLSLTGFAVSPVVPIADRLRATPTELEYIFFYIGKLKLDLYQQEPTQEHLQELERVVRRLGRIPNLHAMSKLMIARTRELSDPAYGYDIAYDIKIPAGLAMWTFMVGYPGGVIVNDFREEYQKVANARKPPILGYLCVFTVLGCIASIRPQDEAVILDLLRSPIRLEVRDKNQNVVSIPSPAIFEK